MSEDSNPYEVGQVLLINKPFQWTSFDVIHKLRSILRIKKIGHAGTLDPLATGLLIICTGKFTKRINEFMAREKEYIGSFYLGAQTPTYDLESDPVNFKPIENISKEEILKAASQFTGEIMQSPPAHSAVKIGGKRSYEMARQGKAIIPEPRKINIREFEITGIELPQIHFRVVCSTGTYIRSLANDFGMLLGCGAYLSALCRTRIGEFILENAETPEAFEQRFRTSKQQNLS